MVYTELRKSAPFPAIFFYFLLQSSRFPPETILFEPDFDVFPVKLHRPKIPLLVSLTFTRWCS